MSLYANFTIKEWLAFYCSMNDVQDLFRKALKDNDEPMAVLALADLTRRGDTDLVTYAIQEATNAGYIVSGSRFSIVFTNALLHFGSRDPILKRIGENARDKGCWPKTAAELLGDSKPTGKGHSSMGIQIFSRDFPDKRLGEFLGSFVRKGRFLIEFGFFDSSYELDPCLKDQRNFINAREEYSLIIENGSILDVLKIPDVLNVLDAAGIADPLPVFNGKESIFYTIDDEGNWVDLDKTDKEKFFYVTYYSVF